jgi:NADH oxidase (H2O2-forming)
MAEPIVVIGCGDAGLSAAFAAAKEGADVVVISDEKEYYPRCPLPYYIGGEIKREELAKPLESMFRGTKVKVVFDRAVKICGDAVICEKTNVRFSKAVIATGGKAKRIGNSLALRTIADADEIRKKAKKSKPVIIGGGMLGCEMADVLGGTLVEAQERILPNFDSEFSELIADKLLKKAEIKAGTTKAPKSDFIISAVGVAPDNELAKASGIRTSEFGIVVDNRLETSRPGVYAAGDCIEEKCFFTKRPMHSYLGPQAERQGVIAGINAAGGDMRYEGSLNAVVAKIAGYEIGVTGMCSVEAERKGLKTTFGRVKTLTKPDYDKSAQELMIKMLFDGKRLVGCQAVGGEAVDGIINLASYAMQHGATVDDLINLAYCYSPPICSAPNPIILCAENAKRRMRK